MLLVTFQWKKLVPVVGTPSNCKIFQNYPKTQEMTAQKLACESNIQEAYIKFSWVYSQDIHVFKIKLR
jgi:hypothetical protein